VYNLPKIFIMDVIYVTDQCTGLPKPVTVLTAFYHNHYFTSIYTYGLWYGFIVIVPWGTIIFMNGVLIHSLRRSAQGDLGGDHNKRTKETKAITVRILAVSVVFITLEAPQVITNIIYTVIVITKSERGIDMPLLHNILGNSYFLATINSFINFYIYCVTGKAFRATLMKIFKRPQRQ
jgi:hypothetical protein